MEHKTYHHNIAEHEDCLDEQMALDLMVEYVDHLNKGERLDPREYIARYTGPRKDIFKDELYFIILTEKIGGLSEESLENKLPPDYVKRTKKLISERIMAELQKRTN